MRDASHCQSLFNLDWIHVCSPARLARAAASAASGSSSAVAASGSKFYGVAPEGKGAGVTRTPP